MNCAPCITRLFSGHLGLSRTRKGGFRYRISPPYRRSLFFYTECLRKRVAYRRPSPVPNFANARKEESIACTECFKRQKGEGHCPEHGPECRREQENHSRRPQNTSANSATTQRPTTVTHPASTASLPPQLHTQPPASTVTHPTNTKKRSPD